MNADEIVKALRESLPPKIDYAELVGAEGFAHGACYVWEDPLPYLMSNAADLLESQQARIAEVEAKLAESQRREQAEKDKIGNWPVYIGSRFCGALIIGADSRSNTVEISWKRGPQEAGKGEAE